MASRVLERIYISPNSPARLRRQCKNVSLVPAPRTDTPAFRVLIYCDRSIGGPALLGSSNLDASRGLRSLSAHEKIQLPIDFATGLSLENAVEFVSALGVEQSRREEAALILVDVYERIFRAAEALTVEIRLELDPSSDSFIAFVLLVITIMTLFLAAIS
jgi:hypothetical protein